LESKSVEDGYKRKFLEFLHREGLKADYLVVPGDISDTAHPAEFVLASQLIRDIAKSLEVPLKRVLAVPGNHDVDWGVLGKPDPSGFRLTQRYAPLQNVACIFKRIMNFKGRSLLESPHFCLWEFDSLLAVGYNSSWHDEPEAVMHHGLVKDDHLDELDRFLSKVELSLSRPRLFIVHHHPIQYSDPIPDEPDFSCMTNAERLMTLLRRYSFDVLIHGHKHHPHFRIDAVDSGFPLVVLGAGSFSVLLDTRWGGTVTNQFHMVKLEGRDVGNEHVQGMVESWSYTCGGGWSPSDPHRGIAHQQPFGTYVYGGELSQRVRPVLEGKLKAATYVEWSDLASDLTELRYLPSNLVDALLQSLSKEIGFRSVTYNNGEIIILKT